MLRKFSFYFKNLRLAKKLTVLLLIIFIGGITLSGLALANILNYKAQDEISSNAWLLFRIINSVRSYTNDEVNPELEQRLGKDEFAAQTIPSYSSRRVFEKLRNDNDAYKDFFYKDAMLNPTNIRDKADSFETEIVQKFRQNKNLKEMSGFRSFDKEKFYYIARPLAITESSCLRCHSTPEAAPKNMIKIYGTEHGFGWKLNLINGVQMVSIPSSQVLQKAHQSFVLVMGIVTMIFAFAIYMANFWLKRYVVRPIKRVVRVAEAVSTGDMDVEFEKVANDEVGSLVEAFTRMKISLVIAIKSLQDQKQ
ncbi:putative sensor with HAMP domain protein [Kalymmatonema gypsitolerans NIES-4073]|nr:putative sensor with HAMP domain protein [Scytonema sp. NIES-4073]